MIRVRWPVIFLFFSFSSSDVLKLWDSTNPEILYTVFCLCTGCFLTYMQIALYGHLKVYSATVCVCIYVCSGHGLIG